jgi:hypothetical protein
MAVMPENGGVAEIWTGRERVFVICERSWTMAESENVPGFGNEPV